MIRFYEGKSASFVMFPEDAIQLIKMMGHSGHIPGAILSDNIKASKNNLEISLDKRLSLITTENDLEQEDNKNISLRIRAYPMLKALDSALHNKTYLMWDYA